MKRYSNSRSIENIAGKFKALSHPARIKLISELVNRECCVGEIQKCLSLSQPNVSQHLKILRDARIIEGRRDKNRICYSIKDDAIITIFKTFMEGEF